MGHIKLEPEDARLPHGLMPPPAPPISSAAPPAPSAAGPPEPPPLSNGKPPRGGMIKKEEPGSGSISWLGPMWPPSGSIGKGAGMGMGMGMSPGLMGISPYGKSVDMVDMCTQLMGEGVGEWGRWTRRGGAGLGQHQAGMVHTPRNPSCMLPGLSGMQHACRSGHAACCGRLVV